MTILEFFDHTKVEHLKAFLVLWDTGMWPVGFVPEGTTFPPQWHYNIMAEMAKAWAWHVVSSHGEKPNG